MKRKKKVRIFLIRISIFLLIIVSLTLGSCSNSPEKIKYDKFSDPAVPFGLEYPRTWEQSISSSTPAVVTFEGRFNNYNVVITVVAENKSYQQLFDEYISPTKMVKLDSQDKSIHNIKYSTFTQSAGAMFYTFYICQFKDNISIILTSSIQIGVSHDDKDALGTVTDHMVGTLQ